jgi:hypothetical protein
MKKHLINLSENEREFLKGTFIEKLYEKNIEHFKVTFDLFNNYTNTNNKDKYTYDEFINAYNIVNNQKIEIKKNGVYYYVIMPIIDKLNFSKENLNTIFIDKIKEDNKIILKTSKNILKGEEIFIDYFEKDNIDLFNFYGVTILNNKNPKILSGTKEIKLKDNYFDFDLRTKNPERNILDFIDEVLEFLKVFKNDEIIYLETEKNILYQLAKDFNIDDKKKKVKEIDTILENNYNSDNSIYLGINKNTMKNYRIVLNEEIENLEINKSALQKLKKINYFKMMKYKKNGKFDEVKISEKFQKKKENLSIMLNNKLFFTGNDEYDKLREFEGEDFTNFKLDDFDFNNDNSISNELLDQQDNEDEQVSYDEEYGAGLNGGEFNENNENNENQKIFENENQKDGNEDYDDEQVEGDDEDIYEEDDDDEDDDDQDDYEDDDDVFDDDEDEDYDGEFNDEDNDREFNNEDDNRDLDEEDFNNGLKNEKKGNFENIKNNKNSDLNMNMKNMKDDL